MYNTYHLFFYLENKRSNQKSVYRSDFEVSAYTNILTLSNITIASNIKQALNPGDFVKNDLFISPVPSHSITKSEPLFLYYEVYNLSFNDSNITDYQVIYNLSWTIQKKKNFFWKITGIFNKMTEKKKIELINKKESGNQKR